jgi:hypothetical protein
MTFPWTQLYRLVPRGGAGLACDQDGITLGAANLVRSRLGERGRRHCDVQPPQTLRRVLAAAYGPQPDEVVERLHRGLRRAAARLEAGDLAHAGIETVMLALPELAPRAMAKLAGIADLGKRGDAWESEDRDPAGEPDGGGKNITVNNRDYDTSRPGKPYRIPDVRIGSTTLDWTIGEKNIATPQIRDFFLTDSKPEAVVVIRPRQLDPNGASLIRRPENLKRRWPMSPPKTIYVPQSISELIDFVGAVGPSAPTFVERDSRIPNIDINYRFYQLHEGLKAVRKKLGEARYLQLKDMSDLSRTLFEADPEDKTGETRQGRNLWFDMEDILIECASGR